MDYVRNYSINCHLIQWQIMSIIHIEELVQMHIHNILLFLFTMEINSLRVIAYYIKSSTFSSLGNTYISNKLKEMQSQVHSVIVGCPSFHEPKSSHNNIYGQCYQSTFHRHWIRASSNNLPQFTTLPITPQHLFGISLLASSTIIPLNIITIFIYSNLDQFACYCTKHQ